MDEGASSCMRASMSCAGDLVSVLPGSGLSLEDIVISAKRATYARDVLGGLVTGGIISSAWSSSSRRLYRPRGSDVTSSRLGCDTGQTRDELSWCLATAM